MLCSRERRCQILRFMPVECGEFRRLLLLPYS